LKRRSVPSALLRRENLPTLPAVAVEVLRLCRRDDSTLDDLATTIARDPALTAKLLRYSNSSLFNLGSEVTTLQRATLVLGMKSVQLMSLSFSLASHLPRDGQGFDYDSFWRRSLAQAVASRLLTSLSGRAGEDEAFLCGLLANLGQLVMAEGDQGYARVIDAAGDRWPGTAEEVHVLGYHRGDVTRELLGSWRLPPIIHLGVGYVHDQGDLPEDTPDLVREVVEVLDAAGLAVDVLCGESGRALVRLEEVAKERFALTAEQVGAYLLALEGAFREASELLDLPMPTDRSHDEIVAAARATMLQVGLEAAGELRESLAPIDLEHRESIPGDATLLEPVTGLLGREGFETYVRAEVLARATAPVAHAFGVLLLVIDDAAALLGGGAVREAQRSVATVLKRMTRKGDVPVRLEGSRFAVLIPQCSAFGLRTLAERIRVGVAQLQPSAGVADHGLTVSLGGACIGRAARTGDGGALIQVAERYLERALEHGGNATLVHATVIHQAAA
jgi:diguanylate cyclase (GGDEF)-like protein